MFETQDGNHNRRKIVCIGAHPDDIELGMAGTVAKHIKRGDDVLIVICTLGIGGKCGDPRIREDEAKAAAQILGARLSIIDYPVTRLNRPSVEFTEILRKKIHEITPDRIYTHSPFDYHQVHDAVSQCSMQASSDVPQILMYEEASSTSPDFHPNAYVDITDYLHFKVQCLHCHKTQSEKIYIQNNITSALAHSRYVLGKVGKNPNGMAEAFMIARFAVNTTRPKKILPTLPQGISAISEESGLHQHPDQFAKNRQTSIVE